MEQISSPIKRSWARQCSCGAAWRFYEDEVESMVEDGAHTDRMEITCPACSLRLEVTGMIRFSIRNNIAVKAIRAQRKGIENAGDS